MLRPFFAPPWYATFLLLVLHAAGSSAQVIDFETIPAGGATVDQQTISTEYATFGVTFTLLDPITGVPSGFPLIAKAGLPQTAFEGCFGADTPLPTIGLGSSFLTDGTGLGVQGDLKIEYSSPVAQASGVILDIDCRIGGGAPCEQWTITAYDATDALLQTVILDGPVGPTNPQCATPAAGPGDSEAFGWVVDVGTPQISSIILKHTGEASNVGLAFDNFSVSTLPGPPTVTASTNADSTCPGERVLLSSEVSGGVPQYTYLWQLEVSAGVWSDLGTESTQAANPLVSSRYRVIVTDSQANATPSDPVQVTVADGDPLCSATLLVSSFQNDRIVRYSFLSRQPQVMVPHAGGSGGLNGPSKLTCGPDGNLYVSSQLNDRVYRYDGSTGEFSDVFVSTGSGGLNLPVGLDFGPDGNLYVVSNLNHSVLRYDGSTGAFIDTFVPNGSGLNNPTALVFGPDGNLYVCSRNSNKVLRFNGSTGAFIDDFVTAGSGGLSSPRGLVFGPDGNLYIGEETQDSVSRYNGATGAFIDVFVTSGSGGLDRANDVEFGPDGNLYVASFNNSLVLRYDGTTGVFLDVLANDGGTVDGAAWLTLACQPSVTAAPTPRIPASIALRVSYDQGFGGPATIAFDLDRPANVDVAVYDARGRVIASLLSDALGTGSHRLHWQGRDSRGTQVARGFYFVTLEARSEGGVQRATGKVVLLR